LVLVVFAKTKNGSLFLTILTGLMTIFRKKAAIYDNAIGTYKEYIHGVSEPQNPSVEVVKRNSMNKDPIHIIVNCMPRFVLLYFELKLKYPDNRWKQMVAALCFILFYIYISISWF
jgi:hypothetical protein